MSLGVGDKEEGNPPAVNDILRHYLWCNMVTHIQPLADGKYRIVTQFGNRDYFLFAAKPEAEDGVNVSKRITIWTIEYVSERGSYMIHRDAGGVLQATNAGTVMTNRNHFHAFELHRYWAIIGNPSDGYVMTPLSSPTSGAMVCPTPKLGAELPVKLGGIVPGAVGSQQLWKFESV